MQALAQNYLVYQISEAASAIGYVSAASGLSTLALSFFGGIVADRVGKRLLLVISQLSMVVFTIILGVLITTDQIQIWHIVVTAIIIGAISAFNMPARQSYVPDIVGTSNLTSALALNSGIMNLTRIVGPALAGVLIGLIGIAALYYIKAATYVLFVILLLMIPISGKSKSSGRSLAGDAIDGVRYLGRDAKVRDLLILSIGPVVLGTPYVNFLPVFQEEVFHVGPTELGWMMSIVGAGAVIGALIVAFLGKYRRKGLILMGSGVSFGATLALFAVTSLLGNFGMSLVMLALVGATGTAFMALNNVMVQTITPPEMRGRVMGVYVTTFGLTALGALPMGALSDLIGAPFTTLIFGTLTLASVAILFAVRRDLINL